ncbi:hypothetical protein CINTURNW_2680 [Clostridium intestinale URNW]|uniref:Uncharacterized protein n=2 Tax=Clostridium intestinale TaxID=36845 RepID=U2N4K1_9CLOT|nr:hypothetical protein [Clostridium intestinale]ERK30432.1 hypothetical protein CINTURNW_2680 [Clostridium intestinale URNW]QLY81369.1 hypothetical protein HZF06_07245 [Clostridium intestinale]
MLIRNTFSHNPSIQVTSCSIILISYVTYSIQIFCIAYFSKYNKYKNLTEVNIEMLKWLYENEEKLIVKWRIYIKRIERI